MTSHFKEKSIIIDLSINQSQSNGQIFLYQINVKPKLTTVKFGESFWKHGFGCKMMKLDDLRKI